MKNKIHFCLLSVILILTVSSCQKMERPKLGDYAKDATAPGGPLKFYAAFDGTSSNPLLNAVDSVRANFAAENPLTSIPGISGKAIQGADQKAIKYNSPNDFADNLSSFSVSLWLKNNPVPGDPQWVFSLPHKDLWFSSAILFYIESGSTASSAKAWFYMNEPGSTGGQGGPENWFDFSGSASIPNLLDNNWHHLVITYDETTSDLKMYKDGVLLHTMTWTGHGPLKVIKSKISGLVIGGMNKHVGLDGWTDGWIQSWQGGLDQFRLYGKKVLTASEVTALYNSKL